MSKNPSTNKIALISSSISLILIFIALIPVSKKANYFNQCINKTILWINEKEKDIKEWDKKSKETLAVAVCNGAVYEPRFKNR